MTTNASTGPDAAPQDRHHGLVFGPDSPLGALVRTCERIARSDATVLLTGETGTGKEVFARAIHASSPRAGRPLVPVNCGAIPEALLESELFGHVRGAFTGAMTARRGRVAAAEGGTLFLDEIGELPLALQVKLLRVLQERTYEPVGSTEAVPADFRLVAATNRDLSAEVAAGRFRRDLYYRLLVCPLEIPPLRARKGDALRLFQHFWAARGERRPLEPAVAEALAAYDWPGNVRELENLVERLSVCAEGAVIRVADLPVALRCRRANDATRALAVAASPAAEAAPAPAAPAPIAFPAPARELAAPVAPQGDATAPAAAEIAEVAAVRADALEEGIDPALLRALTAEVAPSPAEPSFAAGRPVDLPNLLRRLEDAYIAAALARTGGNKKAAADLLGLQRTTLVEKLRRRNREPGAAAPRAAQA
ncbi:sigma-54 interaction domain-containing protein [Anaeromyxobacter dehalogenans]|uniref:Sigma54 specific transcriptional regulator with PAS sensor, Fis family n=1 Tax=Anaeromyxobacter dehalogenans (strain 2CP-C) TaxID=290397 RepID=Q2IQU3_ANADE|nr:sigma 54-interacting transcriptional regulator [Anaeromyxobacter dehalogenans]ABC81173.1 sigma54 specific transcriptional regulator with PAS sensor, Fis family [Anaeromyxobacter dehalogenans 2CP-C]